MLFIEPRYSAASLKAYYTQHLSRDDYYTRGQGEVIGQVGGRGAALLGMPGDADREMYFRLIDGRHPMTGERLGGRAVKDARIAYEITADMPKEATLLYRLGGDKQIRMDHDAALAETLSEVESDMRTRVRKGGQDHDRVTANMVYFKFPHHVTRNLDDGTCDAQEHDHIIAPNKTFDPVEGEWKAGQWGAIKTDALYYQAALHARQAKRWADRDYAIERDGKSFRILGIDRGLVNKFSRRTREIEEEAERKGITDAKEKSRIGRKMRNPKKTEETPLEELTAEWKARCTPEELRSLKEARHTTLQGNATTPEEARDYAIAHCFQKEAVVSEKRLWAEALMHGVGSVRPEDIKVAFEQRKDLIASEKDGIRYVTTREWRQAENKAIAFPRDGRGTCKQLWTPGVRLNPSLDAEQRAAAETLLTSRDRVMLLVGAAGAGKTYTMLAVRDVIDKAGKWGGAFALSAQASRKNLVEAGFPGADTVARLITDEKLQQSLAGKVVFVDEFGLNDVKLANRIFDLAKRHDWRLILAGDAKQHGPVEGPSALRLIERHSGLRKATLLENRRQQDKGYKAAVDATRGGNELTPDGKTTYLQRAVAMLDAQKRIVELPKESLYAAAAREYLDIPTKAIKGREQTRLMVTTTHAEGAAVVKDIRAGLRGDGKLTGKDRAIATLTRMDWSDAQRGQAVNYQPGLVVQFDQNVKGGIKRGERVTVVERNGNAVIAARATGRKLDLPLDKAKDFEVYRTGAIQVAAGDLVRPTKNGQTLPVMRAGIKQVSKISNGDLYRVSGFTKDGDLVCDNGFVIPKNFGHIKPGDTITSFSSQSRTVDHLRAVITESAMTAANIEQFYVTLSRGRKSAFIFTDNKAALLDAVRHSGARMSAMELLGAETPQQRRPGMLHALRAHTHRIRRAGQAFFNRGREIYLELTRGKEQDYAR